MLIGMNRHGPMSAGELPGLAIGDRHARHLVLQRDHLEYVGDDTRERWAWVDVEAVRLDVPDTAWFHPVMPDLVVPFVLAVFGGGADAPDPRDLHLTVMPRGDDTVKRTLSGHWASGYPRRQARAVARLVELMHRSPESRALLDHPTDVLRRLRRITGDRRA